MPTEKKINLALLYGGVSGEHEISLISAANVYNNLDREKFSVFPIGIDQQGCWFINDPEQVLAEDGKTLQVQTAEAHALGELPLTLGSTASSHLPAIDAVFPIMHGPIYEDGCIQGLLEVLDLPYVGPGVLSSALAMDKIQSKIVAASAGITVGPYIAYERATLPEEDLLKQQIAEKLKFPVFVKPANLGSSVGIHKVHRVEDVCAAIADAVLYDEKIIVEQGIDGREIELAVLENKEEGELPLVTVAGEITVAPHHDFYSYESKYLDPNGSKLSIPASLDAAQLQQAQQLAQRVFKLLDCSGMGRVDLLLERQSGKFFFNELNTIPGFTAISLYPKLWEHSGMSCTELLSYLVELAIARGKRRRALKRSY